MDELDVEAVDSVDHDDTDGGTDGPARETVAETLPTGVEAPEYVLYGGKGGVGKTTAAAATALASAADGVATLVVSTDPAHSLSDTLGTEIAAEPARIREDVPLYAAEIDPEAAVDDSVFGAMGGDGPGANAGAGAGPAAGPGAGAGAAGPGPGPGPDGDAGGAGPFGGLGDAGDAGDAGDDPMGLGGLFGGAMGGGDVAGMPGADEAAAMQTLLRYLDDPRFDRVVVDTAPTGHTLRLLELPEFLDTMVGRLMKLRERMGGLLGSVTGMFGDDDADARADLDELADRIERLRAVLRDPSRTDFRVVLVPEEMSVVESERLVARLDDAGIPVSTVVVNRVMEPLSSVIDVEAAAVDPDWVVEPDLDGCGFCARRWDVQQAALARASELFRGRDVRRIPLLADDVRGEAALRVVAACLTARAGSAVGGR
jgi:arsenite-transporting ATPase